MLSVPIAKAPGKSVWGKIGSPYVGRFRSSAMAFVKFIGTHSGHDRVDVLTISQY